LAGRTLELAAVVDVMTSSRRALTVTGEPGVGKSRLIAEAATVVEGHGAVVLRGQCLPLAANLPLLPFLAVLRALVDLENGQVWSTVLEACPSSVGREVIRLLPDSAEPQGGGEAGQLDGDWQQERLFDAVRRALTAAAEHRGVAVVIEDVHWADQTTVDLLEYLLAPSHAVSAPIVLTYRTGDPALPRGDTWLARQPRIPGMSVLTLSPLGFADAATQIRSLAGRELPMADVQTLFERSEGNPFFIEQLVQSVLDLAGGGSVNRLPQGLTSLLMSRTEQVAGSARDVMACLAVAAGGVDEAFLAECCAHPVPLIREALRELAERRLLRSDRDAGFRLAHALLAEAITESMLPGEVREWHHRIGEVMAQQPDTGAAAAVAEHFKAAGLDTEELRWRVAAAERSEAVFARSEAAAHWMRAVSLLESPLPPETPEGTTPAGIYAAAARCVKLTGDGARATVLAQSGLGRLGEEPDLATRAALLAEFSSHPFSGDPQASREALTEAVEIYERLPPSVGYLYAVNGLWNSYQASPHPETAVAALDRALAVAPELDAPMPHLLLLRDRAGVDVAQGNPDVALDRMSEARQLLTLIEDPFARIAFANTQTGILLAMGRLEEVLPAAEGLGFTWAATAQEDQKTTIVRTNVFEALTELGDVQGAAAVIDPVTEGTPQPGTWYAYAARAKLEMLRGHLNESDERWDALPRMADPSVDVEFEPWRLELTLWRRQPQRALSQGLDILKSLIDTSHTRQTGQLLLMAIRAHADLTRLPTTGNRRLSPAESEETLKTIHSRMAEDPLSLGPLRPIGDADGLLWQAEWARATHITDSARWDAAATAYERHNRPHVAAYARWRQAEALLVEDARARATPVLQHADRLASQHVPLHTAIAKLATRAHIRTDKPVSEPGPAAPNPFGLTSREMTVLKLVCDGDTNAKIGAQLFITEKTASVHVSNILRKLEVSSRIQAAAVAEQLGLLSESD
jgi:DNA-binding CsgD family transcriptional regulator